jgi:hypothetical protein
MKKILIAAYAVVLAAAGICLIMQYVPLSKLAGWSTPSEKLLTALRGVGTAGFFGIAAGLIVLSLAITAVEKSSTNKKSR